MVKNIDLEQPALPSSGIQLLGTTAEGVPGHIAPTGIKFGGEDNYSKFDSDGTLRFFGDASVWEDLQVSAFDTKVIGSNPPVDAFFRNNGAGVPGVSGALSFLTDSGGGVVSIPDDAVYDWTTDWSFDCWLFISPATTPWQRVVRKLDVFTLSWWGGQTVALNVTNIGFVAGSVQLNVGAWNHVAVTFDNETNHVVTLYINGQIAGTLSGFGSPANNANPLQINDEMNIFGVDDFALWDKTLSQLEVTTRYASGAGVGIIGTEDNLVGAWLFDDASGFVVADSTAGGNDGALSGAEDTHFEWITGHVGAVSAGSRGVALRFFQSGVSQEVFFTVQFPHSRKNDSDIHPHIHCIFPSNGAEGEKVRWGLEYTWCNIGAVMGDTNTAYIENNSVSEDIVAGKHYIYAFEGIDGTGKGLSSMMVCRLFREGGHVNDTYPDVVGFLEFDIHYEVDAIGSRQEYVK